MTAAMEICLCALGVGTGIWAAVTDIRDGIVSNQLLRRAALAAAAMDAIYYIFCVSDLGIPFLVNVLIVSAIAFLLFATHCWAGGDTKLMCVLALAYPAGCYLHWHGHILTLVFTVALAFTCGFVYLIAEWIRALVRRKAHISGKSVLRGLLSFLRSYAVVLIYVSAMTLAFQAMASGGAELSALLRGAAALVLAWIVCSVRALRRPVLVVIMLAAVIVLSIVLRTVPIGTSPLPYIALIVIVILRNAMKERVYVSVPTQDVRAGMILAAGTTAMFASSRVRGLPPVSTEDLRSRLTEEEADAVRRWGGSKNGAASVATVRKMPFAVFILLGFVGYAVLWRILG